MHFLENSNKFYYVELDTSGQLLAANACFYNDISPEYAEAPLPRLVDFIREPVASEFCLKFDKLINGSREQRFDTLFKLHYSASSSHYVLSEWEFCKQDSSVIGIGSRSVSEALGHPLAPSHPSSQELFEVFLNKSETIVFIKDTRGKYLSASPGFYSYFEIKEDKLIGQRDEDVLGKLLGSQCTNSDAETLRKGMTTFQIEYDEHGRQFEVTKFPFTLGDGTPVIGGIMRETTRQYRTDTRLRYIAEQVPGVLFEFHQSASGVGQTFSGRSGANTGTQYNYISPKIFEYTGYTPYEIVNDYVIPFHLIHEKDREHVKTSLTKAGKRLQTSEVDFRIHHRSRPGSCWVRAISKPVRQSNGSLIWYGIVTDISSIKEKEEALRGAERKFHLVAESISDGVLVFNEKGEVVYASASFNRQFNLSPDTLPGKDLKQILDFIHVQDRQQIYDYIIDNLRRKKEHFCYEYRINGPKGELWWREDSTSVIYDEYGKMKRAYVVARDITKRKKTENELRYSLDLLTNQNNRLTSFTHIVSHNLRSHTSNILGLLSLKEDDSSEKELHEILSMLNTPARKLDEALHHLNKIISIQSNLSRKHTRINLRDYVDKTMDLLRGSFEMVYAKTKVKVPQNMQVYCIPEYMESILLNLLTNAVRYRHEERRLMIEITGAEQEQWFVISITDNGLGIDLDRYRSKLFGMYKTFHNKPDARGIGLFITKNQVDAMGGHIEVNSRIGDDSGTTFSVYLQKKPDIANQP
jgi:PAS domain S-box-containing protein